MQSTNNSTKCVCLKIQTPKKQDHVDHTIIVFFIYSHHPSVSFGWMRERDSIRCLCIFSIKHDRFDHTHKCSFLSYQILVSLWHTNCGLLWVVFYSYFFIETLEEMRIIRRVEQIIGNEKTIFIFVLERSHTIIMLVISYALLRAGLDFN